MRVPGWPCWRPVAGAYVAAGRTIWSIAGNGVPCASPIVGCGDGPSAIDANLNNPSGLAVAADGSVYIADTASHKIRKVTTSGTISTVAGTGEPCTPAVAACGDGGTASTAQLSSPRGLALAADGTLYVADSGTNRVRRISSAGTITTVAGNGRAVQRRATRLRRRRPGDGSAAARPVRDRAGESRG